MSCLPTLKLSSVLFHRRMQSEVRLFFDLLNDRLRESFQSRLNADFDKLIHELIAACASMMSKGLDHAKEIGLKAGWYRKKNANVLGFAGMAQLADELLKSCNFLHDSPKLKSGPK
jgi:hypothetical protein